MLAAAMEVDEDYKRYRQQRSTIVQPNQPLSARRPFNDNRTVEYMKSRIL